MSVYFEKQSQKQTSHSLFLRKGGGGGGGWSLLSVFPCLLDLHWSSEKCSAL